MNAREYADFAAILDEAGSILDRENRPAMAMQFRKAKHAITELLIERSELREQVAALTRDLVKANLALAQAKRDLAVAEDTLDETALEAVKGYLDLKGGPR